MCAALQDVLSICLKFLSEILLADQVITARKHGVEAWSVGRSRTSCLGAYDDTIAMKLSKSSK